MPTVDGDGSAVPIPRSPRQPPPRHEVLPLKVVRPPQLSEGCLLLRVPNRHRPTLNRPQPFVPVTDALRAAAAAVRYQPDHTMMLPAPAARPDTAGAKQGAASARGGGRGGGAAEGASIQPTEAAKLQMHQPHRNAVDVRDLYQARIESWPGQASSQLLESVGRILVEADRQEHPLLRADRVMVAMRLMAEQMPRYAPVFTALATETQLLVSAVAESKEAAELIRSEIDRLREECEATLGNQQLAFREERDTWLASRDARDDQLENATRDLMTIQRRLVDQSIEMDSVRRVNEEAYIAKKNFEAMATQFAERNKSLTDKIADLDRQLEAATNRADAATAANYKYAQRLLSLEEYTAGDTNDHKLAMAKIADALEVMTGKYRTSQASTTTLREQFKNAEIEAATARAELDELLAKQDEMARAFTPRPDFEDRDASLFNGLSSTANRFALLSDAVLACTQKEADRMSEYNMLLAAAHLGRLSNDSLRLISSKVPPVVLAPVANTVNSRTAPWLVTNLPSIKTTQMLLREFIPVIRKHYVDHLNLEKEMVPKLVPFVELHCSVLYTFQATNALPGPCAEQCYNLYYACYGWASVALVRVFLCTMREEVGPWVYATQNALIVRVMRVLAKCTGGSIADYRGIVASTLRAEGFGEASVAVAIAQFIKIYTAASEAPTPANFTAGRSMANLTAVAAGSFDSKNSNGMRGMLSSLSPSSRGGGRGGAVGRGGRGGAAPAAWADVSLGVLPPVLSQSSASTSPSSGDDTEDESEITVTVEFEESRHGPSNMVTVSELPFISVLRRMHLERLLTFYTALDAELLVRTKASTRSANTTAALNALVSPMLLATALVAVLPVVSHTEALAWAASVFATCAAQNVVEKTFLKNNKREADAATSYFISNRSLPLSGLNRWYCPSVGLPFPRPAVSTAAIVGDERNRKIVPGRAAVAVSSNAAASPTAPKRDVLAAVKLAMKLVVPPAASSKSRTGVAVATASAGGGGNVAAVDDDDDDYSTSQQFDLVPVFAAVVESDGDGSDTESRAGGGWSEAAQKGTAGSGPGRALNPSSTLASPSDVARRRSTVLGGSVRGATPDPTASPKTLSSKPMAPTPTFSLVTVLRMVRKVEFNPPALDM